MRATAAYPVRQDATQWLGSNLIGAKVVSASNETIGQVANLVVNEDGAIEAAVISIGGMFGFGRKDVAVTYKSLNIVRNTAGDGDRPRHPRGDQERSAAARRSSSRCRGRTPTSGTARRVSRCRG